MDQGVDLEEIEVNCCVCMMEESDMVCFRDDLGEIKGLPDLVEEELAVAKVRETPVLLKSACGSHCICSFCLHYLATSFGSNHPIGPDHPMIPCPYPFGDCVTLETQMPNYFPHSQIEKLLSVDELEIYRAHCARYQFPGYELVFCPRPSRYDRPCGAGILVATEEIDNTLMGRLIIRCDQNPSCRRKTCYHCRNLVHRARTWCDYCLTSSENEQPNGLNHYFYRPGKRISDGFPNLWRNNEITPELAVQQIREMIAAERLEIKCTNCLTLMFKTEKCNTLKHCGIERCYSCGRSGTINRKLGDHWDSSGIKGCPRFDASVYWNTIGKCDFQCVEGECYGDEIGDCTNATHQMGIQAMISQRKRAHIYHALLSLLPAIRVEVLEILGTTPNIRKWLPKYWSSDYHTYLGDTVKSFSESGMEVTAGLSISPTSLQRKLDGLSFEPVEYPPEPVQSWKHQNLFVKFCDRYGRNARQR